MKKIGIIFAMEEELNEFLKYISLNKKNKIFDLTFYEGDFDNLEIVLVQCGVGKVNAARCTQILIDNYKPSYVFNIGVAGGVSDELNVLDIVIADRLVQHDFDITAFDHDKGYIPNIGIYTKCDNNLVDIARQNKDVFTGVIASGDIFCTDKKMGKKINDKFNALCVEMEGAAVGQVCSLCDVPFLVIRSISDCPNNNNLITYEEFLNESCRKIALFMNDLLKKINKTV